MASNQESDRSARPVSGSLNEPDDEQPRAAERDVNDPEEKITELWAPAARSLFADVAPGKANDCAPRVDTRPERRPPPPTERQEGTSEPPADVSRPREPEEAATELMDHPPEGMETLEMAPGEAAAAIAEAEQEAARLLSATVEVTGEEGRAARQLAAREQTLEDPTLTLVVDKDKVPRLNRRCRMCDRRVTRPKRRRLRGSPQSDDGFRCEKCNNIFCAAHVVRVSNIFASVISGARFRCQLCLPRARPPRTT